MEGRQFNLLREKWIPVMRRDGGVDEVSLLEAIDQSAGIRDFAGELPTMDFALLRLLLAILHASLGRQQNGSHPPLSGEGAFQANPGRMMTRWKKIWDAGSFPMGVIEEYLAKYEDRFWLFHPESPFYQVERMGKATEYTGAKLNGALAESSNKLRLFPERTGTSRDRLPYPEAARWLVYLNGYDDTSAKKTQKDLPSPGAGWLGKLGPVWACGESLFHTLMLNWVLLPDGGNSLWGIERPCWSLEKARGMERTELNVPDNQSELLTLQSRRLLLQTDGAQVVGFTLLGGDFFPPAQEVFAEQMTLWRKVKKKEPGKREYPPKRHDSGRKLWRDFAALTAQGPELRRPGVVSWLSRLASEGILSQRHFRFRIAAVKYGDKDFFADDVFGDSLSFSASLLTDKSQEWVARIISILDWTDQLVGELKYLAQQLSKASGDSQGLDSREAAGKRAYFLLDLPFREWLAGINPETDDSETLVGAWKSLAKNLIRSEGREMVRESGPKALVGRTLKENNVFRRYTAAEAFSGFNRKVSIH